MLYFPSAKYIPAMSISDWRILVFHRQKISMILCSWIGFAICASIFRGGLISMSRFGPNGGISATPRGGQCGCAVSALVRLHRARRPLYVPIRPHGELSHTPSFRPADPVALTRTHSVATPFSANP